jgi:hypothetical protein
LFVEVVIDNNDDDEFCTFCIRGLMIRCVGNTEEEENNGNVVFKPNPPRFS